MKLILLILSIFLISCEPQKNNSSQLRNLIIDNKSQHGSLDKKKHKNEEDTINKVNNISSLKYVPHIEIKNGCNNTKDILHEIQSFINDKKLLNNEKMIYLFSQNEKENSHCYFPNSDVELKILYSFINELLVKSNKNYQVISFIITLDGIIIRNVEVSEYLTFDLLPLIALRDTKIFLQILSSLENYKQEDIIENLAFSKENKIKFLNQINSFENKKELKNMGISGYLVFNKII
jgi:hypothetical protein